MPSTFDSQNSASTSALHIWREPSLPPSEGRSGAPFVPGSPAELLAHYDLTISHPEVDAVSFRAFHAWLAEEAASRGLTCALLHDGVVHEAIRRLRQGTMKIGFHLDYFAVWQPANVYAELAQAIDESDGRTINPTAQARRFTDKRHAHTALADHGLGVPRTLFWNPSDTQADVDAAPLLTPGQSGFVFVKPANGFGCRGVHRLDGRDPRWLDWARQAVSGQDAGDIHLIQREVVAPRLPIEGGSPRVAYWRILYCLGKYLPFWWQKQEHAQGQPSYQPLLPCEVERLGLQPVLDYAAEMAEMSGLDWFSTELCLSEGDEPSRYQVEIQGVRYPVVAIDYFNDQCDVVVQSQWLGALPDDVVRYVAGRFAEAALQEREVLRFQPIRRDWGLRAG